jgi:predicted transcriptional regulator
MREYRSPEEQMLRIALIFETENRQLTRLEIARILGYDSTNAIKRQLKHMVEHGLLTEISEARPQGGIRYLYERKRGLVSWLRLEGM